MRNCFFMAIAFLSVACSSQGRSEVQPEPRAQANVEAPEVDCDLALPTDARTKHLPGRTVAHERSCADGHCFADTCQYVKGPHDPGIRVLYDCREETGKSQVRAASYFSTLRKSARPVHGLGTEAAVDDEGLTFYDADAGCLVTIRADGDEEAFVELAHAIETHLSPAAFRR